jgi:hypothetical protein
MRISGVRPSNTDRRAVTGVRTNMSVLKYVCSRRLHDLMLLDVFYRVMEKQELDSLYTGKVEKVQFYYEVVHACRLRLLEVGSSIVLHIFEVAICTNTSLLLSTASSVIRTILFPQPYFFSSPSLTSENSVSCALHSSLYKPPRSISFSCVPDSATLPSFNTMMTSES